VLAINWNIIILINWSLKHLSFILDIQVNSWLLSSTTEPIQTGIFFHHIVILKYYLLALKLSIILNPTVNITCKISYTRDIVRKATFEALPFFRVFQRKKRGWGKRNDLFSFGWKRCIVQHKKMIPAISRRKFQPSR